MSTAIFRHASPQLTPKTGSGWAALKSSGMRVEILKQLSEYSYRVKSPKGIFTALDHELSHWEN